MSYYKTDELCNTSSHHIRDNEVIVADINPKCDTNGYKAFSDTNTVLVNYTLPGRAPVALDSQEKVMGCPSRGGMDIQVRDPLISSHPKVCSPSGETLL